MPAPPVPPHPSSALPPDSLPPEGPDDTMLSAWLDGELSPALGAKVEAWLRDQPETAARVRLWAADRDALRARLEPLADEPLPEAWRQQVMHRGSRGRGLPLAWAAGLLLAGGVLGGGVGAVLVRGMAPAVPVAQRPAPGAVAGLEPGPGGGAGGGSAAPGGATPEPAQGGPATGSVIPATGWLHRAAVAHAVYVPEQRHPVEVEVSQTDPQRRAESEKHLARWLSKRLGVAVRLYDLRPQGFELVGGRLLPDANGPSAQLMYQDARGRRVTLYVRRPEAGVHTEFAHRQEGALSLFYWVEVGYACALVGQMPKDELLALAEAVYHQFEADEASGALGRPGVGDPAAPAASGQPAPGARPDTQSPATPSAAPPAAPPAAQPPRTLPSA